MLRKKFIILMTLGVAFGLASTAHTQSLPGGYDEFPNPDDPKKGKEFETEFQKTIDDFVSICSEVYMDEMTQSDWHMDEHETLGELGYRKSGQVYEKREDLFDSHEYKSVIYVNRNFAGLPISFKLKEDKSTDDVNLPHTGWACAFKFSWEENVENLWLSQSYLGSGIFASLGNTVRSALQERNAPYIGRINSILDVQTSHCWENCPSDRSVVVSFSATQEEISEWRSYNDIPNGLIFTLRADGTLVLPDGKVLGRITQSAEIVNLAGAKIGHIDLGDGYVYDQNGNNIGWTNLILNR